MKNTTVVSVFQKIETEGTCSSRKENKHYFFIDMLFIYLLSFYQIPVENLILIQKIDTFNIKK